MTAAANSAAAPVATKAVKSTHWATLVRGEFYSLGNVVFKPGKPMPVPQYVVDHLKKIAIDVVDVEGEAEDKQKFSFQEIKEGAAPAAVAPRARRRTASPMTADQDELRQS